MADTTNPSDPVAAGTELARLMISRREMLRLASFTALSGTFGSLLAACAPPAAPSTAPTSAPAATSAAGGATSAPATALAASIVVGLVAEPTSMDPAHPTDNNTIARVHPNVFETLVKFKQGSYEVEPLVAESYTVSDDNLTYTFKIRQGITFHDGTPLDADAVIYSFERQLDPNHPEADTGPFPFASWYYGSVDKIEKVDESTVAFTLKEAFTPFITNLAVTIGGIVSPTAVKKERAGFSEAGVGSGPFKLKSWDKSVKMTLERFDGYWGNKARLSEVIYRPIVDEQTRITELLAGGVQLVTDLPPDNIEQIKQNPDLVYAELPGPHAWFLNFNMKSAPFNDIKVRKAVAYAINRQAIITDLLKNTGTPLHSCIPEAFAPYYTPDVTRYEYDPEKAKALLAEAGIAPGTRIKFLVTESGSGMQSPKVMGEAIQADLAKVGIEAEITVLEWGAYLNVYNAGLDAGGYHLAQMSWFYGADPGVVPQATLHSKNWPTNKGFNASYYANPRVDELLDTGLAERDPVKRTAIYHELQRIVADELPNLYFDSQIQTAAMAKTVKGFVLHPSFEQRYVDVTIG
ncbi:MAG: ABC transporter substrate-binding protein [Chloroflexaceae bacterium]|nr:ABC transporter substrate-binding protein [Chloroflexaceae bacterium]